MTQHTPTFSYTAFSDPDYQPAWQTGSLYDCCLVLEGGAMRGQFTAGVLDYLMDEGILPDKVVGVSAGALNGYNYKAGARGRSSYLNLKYCTNWHYLSMRSFVLSGNVFNADYVFHQIPDILEPFDYEAFAASPIQLFTVSSDLKRGEANYHLLRDGHKETDWLRASASLPLLSRIVQIDDQELLDGGVCDSVPIDFAKTLGSRRLIIVLTQAADYVKSAYKLMPLARKIYKDYPHFLERIEQRHIEYNRTYHQVTEMAKSGQALVLRPPQPVEISNMEHDPDKLYQLYVTGYQEAQRRSQEILEYLS